MFAKSQMKQWHCLHKHQPPRLCHPLLSQLLMQNQMLMNRMMQNSSMLVIILKLAFFYRLCHVLCYYCLCIILVYSSDQKIKAPHVLVNFSLPLVHAPCNSYSYLLKIFCPINQTHKELLARIKTDSYMIFVMELMQITSRITFVLIVVNPIQVGLTTVRQK